MSKPRWNPGVKTVPWAKAGDTNAFLRKLTVVIVCEDGTWYGPYDNVGAATRSALIIATKGDNQKRRTPIDRMVLVRERDWPRAYGMASNSHRFAAALTALRDAIRYISDDVEPTKT